MKEPVILTTLVENSVHARGLRAEHGLSFHLQVGPHSLLFDTGQSVLFLHNAPKLGVNLVETEAIVLSHGHNDHSGGIAAAREAAPKARLYLHPAALDPKFAANPDGTSRANGMDPTSAAAIRSDASNVTWTRKPTEILEGICVTGEVPRTNDFEDTGGPFFLDPACAQPDPLTDDQALFFDTAKGIVVLLGCAHSGVVNTLDYIRRLSSRPIHTVIGGMHLLAAAPGRIEKTLEAFRRLNIECLAPGHCTGLPAMARLWTALPQGCTQCTVGSRFTFQR